MHHFRKLVPYIIGSVLLLLGLYVLCRGLLIAGENGWGGNGFFKKLPGKLEELAVDTYNGILTWETETETGSRPGEGMGRKVMDVLFPPMEEETEQETATEREKERESETETEQYTVSEEETSVEETSAETDPSSVSVFSNAAIPMPAAESLRQSPQVLPWDKMKDFHFLLDQYFILDASAAIDEDLLDLDTLMGKDLTIHTDTDGPQILIYHTHSQEAFADSRPGDLRDTIMGVGERLKEILTEQYGFEVLHHTKVYDMINGKLDRNKAYNLAAPDIEAILKAYPSIQVVIDLHRDGVEDYRFVTEFNGKPVAKIMFFNGLSYSARNGPVEYLPNPYIADNLAFSFQLQMKAEEYYPGFTRNIYLQSLRYNQHLSSHSLLIESGTQLNTVEEEYNAMEPLADILNQVLRGK